MSPETLKFIPIANKGPELSSQQSDLINEVLKIGIDHSGIRGELIKVPKYPLTSVKIAEDGLKLIVSSSQEQLFFKVYIKESHTIFVASALQRLSEIIKENPIPDVRLADCENVLGYLDRALIFNFDPIFLREDCKKIETDSRANSLRMILSKIPETEQKFFDTILALPSILELPNGQYSLSDLIKDSCSELRYLVEHK